jgi:hypothetical protein
MKINVVKRVDVEVTQEDVKNMIRDHVLAHDPDIVIDSIEFVRKLNPQRIEIEVDAYFGKRDKKEPVEVKEVVDDEEEDIIEAAGSSAQTVGDIFGED